jgi:hypothetical protein
MKNMWIWKILKFSEKNRSEKKKTCSYHNYNLLFLRYKEKKLKKTIKVNLTEYEKKIIRNLCDFIKKKRKK